MKKVLLVAALSFGTMTAFAQEEETTVQEVATEVIEAQDAFAEVAIEELPETITEAHPGATISKAYVNEAAQYKLEVAKEDGETLELYADAEGNWIEL